MTADPVEVMRDAMAKARAAWFGVPMELTDERDELFAEYARAALAALDAAGLVVVPREPTEAMAQAGSAVEGYVRDDYSYIGEEIGDRPARDCWTAMLSAALTPPTSPTPIDKTMWTKEPH